MAIDTQPPSDQQTWLVFISHAKEDQLLAQQISARIRECGAMTFIAETDTIIGGDREEATRLALERANELLLIISQRALNRRFVWVEIGVAWYRQIPIIGMLNGMSREQLRVEDAQTGVPVISRLRVISENELGLYLAQLKERMESI